VMDVSQTELPCGVRVVSAPMASVESVSLGIWTGVGGRYEPACLGGASHFIEHMLFKGTRRRNARQISNAVEGVGGQLNAFTQEESTCFYARVGFDHSWRALDVLCDMYLNSLFDGRELDRERNVIVEEIMMYRDQPPHHVQEVLTQSLWKSHPLGRPISGDPETIRRMGRKDMIAFMERHYTGRNTVVAFAGRVRHEECVKRTADLLGGLSRGGRAACRPVTESVGQRPVALVSKDIEQSHVAIGVRVFGREDPRRYALGVLNTVLGGNMSSRLFQNVREKRGLAYSIHSSVQLLADSGALVIEAGLDRGRTVKGLEVVMAEIRRLRNAPVGGAELKRAKDFVVGQVRLGLESTSRQMLWAGENLVTIGRFLPPEEVIAGIAAVTAEDVRRLAREVLVAKRASLAVVGPDGVIGGEKKAAGLLAGME